MKPLVASFFSEFLRAGVVSGSEGKMENEHNFQLVRVVGKWDDNVERRVFFAEMGRAH